VPTVSLWPGLLQFLSENCLFMCMCMYGYVDIVRLFVPTWMNNQVLQVVYIRTIHNEACIMLICKIGLLAALVQKWFHFSGFKIGYSGYPNTSRLVFLVKFSGILDLQLKILLLSLRLPGNASILYDRVYSN